MAINRAKEARQLQPGLAALCGQEYRAYGDEHLQVFDKGTSEKAFELELVTYGFGTTQIKPEGEAVQYDESGEQYVARYDHVLVAGAFAITKEAIDDNVYVAVAERNVRSMARAMHNTKQVIHASVLNNAFSSSYPIGDGVALCSTSHPVQAGVAANTFTTYQQLNEGSVENANIDIAQFTDYRGLLIQARGQKLIVPRNLMYTASRLIDTPLRPFTMNNDINAMRETNTMPNGYFVYDYLTSTTTWFIKTDVPDGLKSYERQPLERDEDHDFDTANWRFRMSERYSAGATDWRGVFGGSN